MNPCQPSTTSVHLTSIRLKWHLVWIRHDRKFDTANCDEDISLLYKLFYRLFYTIGGWAQIAKSTHVPIARGETTPAWPRTPASPRGIACTAARRSMHDTLRFGSARGVVNVLFPSWLWAQCGLRAVASAVPSKSRIIASVQPRRKRSLTETNPAGRSPGSVGCNATSLPSSRSAPASAAGATLSGLGLMLTIDTQVGTQLLPQ